MFSSISGIQEIELQRMENGQEEGLLNERRVIPPNRNWAELTTKEKAQELFLNGAGLGCLSGIATAFFGATTVVLIKIEERDRNERGTPAYLATAIATGLFGLFFFGALFSCCYAVAIRKKEARELPDREEKS